MIFARIWNGLLAGALAALPVTLCLVAAKALILPGDPVGREALTPAFLVIWAICSLICAVPAGTRGQWLAALWLAAGMLLTLAVVFGVVMPAPIPIATTVIAGIAMILLAFGLRGTARPT